MKILAVEKNVKGVSEKQFQPYLKDEAKKVWGLVQSGIIREVYFTKEDNRAVIILECSDKEAADRILNTLPLAKEKLISFDVQTLIPYNGFSRLFK